MAKPPITLQVLPAGYGDSLLVSCPVGNRTWRLLVDTGPDECWPMLKAQLAAIPKNAAGKRVIDLLVISHIDHDHIGGAALLLADRELGLVFKDVWFNAPGLRRLRGVAEGVRLADLLGAGDPATPWNRAFGGKLCCVPAGSLFSEVPGRVGLPRLTLLSPTSGILDALFAVWERELQRFKERERDPPAPVAASRGTLDLVALASRPTPVDRAVPNGSSIALLVEHRGASLLLGADAFPTVLNAAIGSLARSRGLSSGLKVDVLKVSHHGSRGNTTIDLLKTVQARHYVISTNGAIFGHPNDEAIARLITLGGHKPTLWFNYVTDKTQRWADPELQSAHGYEAKTPVGQESGVVLKLPGI